MALRILVVEDDPHTRKVLESLLLRDPALALRHPEITGAEDGLQALAAVTAAPFDLVISDLFMPRLDGFGLCRALRQHPNGGKVPIIVISGVHKDPGMINSLRDEVGAQFFAKPFQLRELLAAVQRVLGVDPDSNTGKRLGRLNLKKVASTSAQPPQGTGNVDERNPAQVILDLCMAQSTGTLFLQRGQVKKEIHFFHGTPVSARSNVRQETFGHFLVSRGIITEAQHLTALTRANERHERLGRAILELEMLTEDVLLKQLGAQFRSRVVSVLRWKKGQYRFQMGEPPVDILQTPVDGATLVMSGLARTAQPDEVGKVLSSESGTLRFTRRGERALDAITRVFGSDVAQLFRDGTHVDAAISSRSLLPALDALLYAGLVELEVHTRPAGPARVAVEATPGPGQKSPFEELFSDEISEVYVLPPEQRRPPSGQADKAWESGANSELRREVLARYLDLQGLDAYAVLDLASDAHLEDIDAAFERQTKRFAYDRYTATDLGRDYQKLDSIHQQLRQAYDTLTSPERRTILDNKRAQARRTGDATSLNADLLATQAQQDLSEERYADAKNALERAVAAQPDQADYHALLAWATMLAANTSEADPSRYEAARTVALASAMPHLERAFILDPDSVEAHHRAAQLTLMAGDEDAALVHLDEVLDRAPPRRPGSTGRDLVDECLQAYSSLCERRGEHTRLAARYRRQLYRFAQEKTVRADKLGPLWAQLGALLRDRLNDRTQAIEALQHAAHHQPTDAAIAEALTQLRGQDQSESDQPEALRQAWRLSPERADFGVRLWKAHRDAQEWDAAFCTAAVLIARRGAAADAAPASFYATHQPRFLQKAATPVPFASIRHPDENPDLTELFGLVLGGRMKPQPGDQVMAAEAVPQMFQRVVDYWASLLSLAPPSIVLRPSLGLVIQSAPGTLVVGQAALDDADQVALGFRLARALVWLGEGRAASAAVSSRRLKTLLYASMLAARSDLDLPDESGELAKEAARLRADATLVPRLLPVVERFLRYVDGQISLSRHLRGLGRSADRVALLLCGDPLRAATFVSVDAEQPPSGVPGAVDDLLDFALSDAHLAARKTLGLALTQPDPAP